MISIEVIYNGKVNKFKEQLQLEKGISLIDIKQKFNHKFDFPILLAKINNKHFELFEKIDNDCTIEFLDIRNQYAYSTYKRTIAFLMINSIRRLLGNQAQLKIKYSINQNWCFNLNDTKITDQLIFDLKKDMKRVISSNLKIEKIRVSIKECNDIFKSYKMFDRANGLKYIKKSFVNLYKLEDTYDYLYGPMSLFTGELGNFEIIKNSDSCFTLCFAKSDNFDEVCEYKEIQKLTDVFEESIKWTKIIGVDYVEALNLAICNQKVKDIILTSEALQEKKIANIADIINNQSKKVVLIAGPSSSGKTTFANRLCTQLKVNGIKPYIISLDDYYLERGKIPINEDGKPDFECLEALDISKINDDLERILKGEEVLIPEYNFFYKIREFKTKLHLKENEVLIVEGIHGLNDKICKNIPENFKFKIFISALNQLNMDAHSRISTTDVRILRRIVRDHYFRGFDVKSTLNMWSNVMEGEIKHIFPFQDDVDVIFNSALIYEIPVLKPFVEPLLYNISSDDEEFAEATRLLKFLDNFLSITCLDYIPPNSIIREFVGGSCFK